MLLVYWFLHNSLVQRNSFMVHCMCHEPLICDAMFTCNATACRSDCFSVISLATPDVAFYWYRLYTKQQRDVFYLMQRHAIIELVYKHVIFEYIWIYYTSTPSLAWRHPVQRHPYIESLTIQSLYDCGASMNDWEVSVLHKTATPVDAALLSPCLSFSHSEGVPRKSFEVS